MRLLAMLQQSVPKEVFEQILKLIGEEVKIALLLLLVVVVLLLLSLCSNIE